MKKITIIILLIYTSFQSYSQNYMLLDKNDENKILKEFIQNSILEGKINNHPVIVVYEHVLKIQN